jgi:hypothetical protein
MSEEVIWMCDGGVIGGKVVAGRSKTAGREERGGGEMSGLYFPYENGYFRGN